MLTKCPYCRGCGKVNSAMRKLPHNLVPLKMLAAEAGLSFGTVWLHKINKLLDAQLWTGIYEKNGRAAVNTINVVTRKEANRYLAWVRDRQANAAKLGQKPGSFKIDAAIARIVAGESIESVAESRKQKKKDLQDILRRRGFDWRAHERTGKVHRFIGNTPKTLREHGVCQ